MHKYRRLLFELDKQTRNKKWYGITHLGKLCKMRLEITSEYLSYLKQEGYVTIERVGQKYHYVITAKGRRFYKS